jgi:hypothetical protein
MFDYNTTYNSVRLDKKKKLHTVVVDVKRKDKHQTVGLQNYN